MNKSDLRVTYKALRKPFSEKEIEEMGLVIAN